MGPFEEHLRDAIRLNHERLELYARLTDGESKSVSKWLLISEKLSLPACKIPDRWARRFNDSGIPIVKEEFMSMSGVSEFREHFPFDALPLEAFQKQNGNWIAGKILKAYRLRGFEGASAQATTELVRLGADRTYHSMLRHILESVIRVANLAPLHEKFRVDSGVKESTLPLSKWLFFSHFSAFQFSTWLDAKAAPLQSRGVPILFQDVPAIPPNSEFYFNLGIR